MSKYIKQNVALIVTLSSKIDELGKEIIQYVNLLSAAPEKLWNQNIMGFMYCCGHGQLVEIRREASEGKTRLMFDFRDEISGKISSSPYSHLTIDVQIEMAKLLNMLYNKESV